MSLEIERVGGQGYGGWVTSTSKLGPGSVVYSFGVGNEISWDLTLIEKFGCTVHAFDPTPRSITWLKTRDLPSKFIFHPYGLEGFDGEAIFYPPKDPNKISYSVSWWPKLSETEERFPVKRLSTIMRELGHGHIDLLKLDIEGSEYRVLNDIGNIGAKQILIDFHAKGVSAGFKCWKLKKAKIQLFLRGYRAVHWNGYADYTYILFKQADNA